MHSIMGLVFCAASGPMLYFMAMAIRRAALHISSVAMLIRRAALHIATLIFYSDVGLLRYHVKSMVTDDNKIDKLTQ